MNAPIGHLMVPIGIRIQFRDLGLRSRIGLKFFRAQFLVVVLIERAKASFFLRHRLQGV